MTNETETTAEVETTAVETTEVGEPKIGNVVDGNYVNGDQIPNRVETKVEASLDPNLVFDNQVEFNELKVLKSLEYSIKEKVLADIQERFGLGREDAMKVALSFMYLPNGTIIYVERDGEARVSEVVESLGL